MDWMRNCAAVMPCLNEAAAIAPLVEAVRRQVATVIVVDDGSTDSTASVAEGAGVTVLQLAKNLGPAAARNYGALHAQGDILFFVDSDVVLAPGGIDQACPPPDWERKVKSSSVRIRARQVTIARSMAFSSSRTLPGQL